MPKVSRISIEIEPASVGPSGEIVFDTFNVSPSNKFLISSVWPLDSSLSSTSMPLPRSRVEFYQEETKARWTSQGISGDPMNKGHHLGDIYSCIGSTDMHPEKLIKPGHQIFIKDVTGIDYPQGTPLAVTVWTYPL